MTIFVSAGEASGDAYGAALVEEIRRLSTTPPAVLAIGGRRLAALADQLVADSSSWGAISISQSLKVVPRVLGRSPRIRRVLKRTPGDNPCVAIPIDFGYFNARFARRAKLDGWKVLAFIPPGSWRRDRQAKWAPDIYDAVSTPFQWSAEILTKMGTPNVHWFGHPMKQLLKERRKAAPAERLNQIAILPGSRKHELANNLPLIAASLPDLPGEFALAPGTDESAFRRRWKELAPGRDDKFTVGDSAGVLLRSKAAIVCSGTATLEAALCRCPMTVIYATSRAMLLEAKLLRIKRPKFVALPNILLDRQVVDELVAVDATPRNVRASLDSILGDGPRREAQLNGFEELDVQLGPDDAITQTARLALEMLGVSTQT